jgi:uncharacterized repeat protein (TIGR03803 family)
MWSNSVLDQALGQVAIPRRAPNSMQSQISKRLRSLALRSIGLTLAVAACIAPVSIAVAGESNLNLVLSLSSVTTGGTGFRGDPLLAADGNFYLATSAGGANTLGAFMQVTPAGVGTLLYSLTPSDTEGMTPFANVMQATDGNFYGTTYYGGSQSRGTVYKITAAGVYTNLTVFTGDNNGPFYPYTGLVQGSDGALYGTTLRGGTSDQGTVFRITVDGTLTTLHSFITSDGSNPEGTLIVGADGALYGTTLIGGANNRGTVYRISLDGKLTTLYSFNTFVGFNSQGVGTNAEGANPRAGLLRGKDGNFYGTTYQGGAAGFGSVFRMTPAGAVTVLRSFAGGPLDGGNPLAGVSQGPDGSLYGTTERGGPAGLGTVWRINAAGTYAMLHGFIAGTVDGSVSYGKVVPLNGYLYGVTYNDASGGGAVYRLTPSAPGTTLPVQFSISTQTIALGQSATLTWSSPTASTCTTAGAWSDTIATSGSLTLTPTSAGIGNFELACVNGAGVTTYAYTALVVTAPPAQSVDGGQVVKADGGGGSFSWPTLAVLALGAGFAALRRRRSFFRFN